MSSGVDAINAAVASVNKAVLDAQVIQNEGQGMAFQVAAHSAALSVQDAGDYMRNFQVLANAAAGKLLAEFVADLDFTKLVGAAAIIALVGEAALAYTAVTAAAAHVAETFPHGQ